jgi:hypothetical protein
MEAFGTPNDGRVRAGLADREAGDVRADGSHKSVRCITDRPRDWPAAAIWVVARIGSPGD